MDLIQTTAPALGLLLLLVLLAWGVSKFRRHLVPGGAQSAQSLRIVSALALGPQHRVVLVEMTEPGTGRRHLITVGVTAHAMSALHSITPGASDAASSNASAAAAATPATPAAGPVPLSPAFQAQLEAQLRAERHE